MMLSTRRVLLAKACIMDIMMHIGLNSVLTIDWWGTL